jgi:hypothetical protein
MNAPAYLDSGDCDVHVSQRPLARVTTGILTKGVLHHSALGSSSTCRKPYGSFFEVLCRRLLTGRAFRVESHALLSETRAFSPKSDGQYVPRVQMGSWADRSDVNQPPGKLELQPHHQQAGA